MLTYSKALELKNAGFPQKFGFGKRHGKGDYILSTGLIFTGENPQAIGQDNIAYVPTLEELIEACGEGFRELCRWEKGNDLGDWQAIGVPHQIYWGPSPEMAMADLYLALHK